MQVLKTLPLHKVDIKIFDIEMNHIDEARIGQINMIENIFFCNLKHHRFMTRQLNCLIPPQVFEGGVKELKAYMDQNGYEAFRNINIDTVS